MNFIEIERGEKRGRTYSRSCSDETNTFIYPNALINLKSKERFYLNLEQLMARDLYFFKHQFLNMIFKLIFKHIAVNTTDFSLILNIL